MVSSLNPIHRAPARKRNKKNIMIKIDFYNHNAHVLGNIFWGNDYWEIFVSYDTPVLIHNITKGTIYRTTTWYSKTTTRQVNRYIKDKEYSNANLYVIPLGQIDFDRVKENIL